MNTVINAVGLVLLLAALLAIGIAMFSVARRATFFRAASLTAVTAVAAVLFAAVGRWVFLPCGWQACDFAGSYERAKHRTVIVARDGTNLGVAEAGMSQWIPLERMPDHVIAAFVSAEDKRFWQHSGVDAIGVGRAVVRNLTGRHQGASGVAMQVAQVLVGDRGLKQLPADGTWPGKLAEMSVGIRTIAELGRARTLEVYLNNVDFAGMRGIDAAAHRYFGVAAEDLSLGQAATLAALVRAPGAFNPVKYPELALRERDRVLAIMRESGAAPLDEIEKAINSPLRTRRAATQVGADLAAAIRQGLTSLGTPAAESIQTGLDLALEREARRNLQRAIDALEPPAARAHGTRLQGVFIAIDPFTGTVRAYVAGRPDGKGLVFDRINLGRVRLASTDKTFLLSAGVEAGVLRLDETMRDVCSRAHARVPAAWLRRQVARSDPSQSIIEAFASSRNLLAICLWELLPAAALARLDSLGFPSASPTVPSEALGTRTMSPLRITAAFASLANGGYFVRPSLVAVGDTPPAGARVWRATTVAAMQQAMHRVIVSGTARYAADGMSGLDDIGLKTGTTDGNREFLVCGHRRSMREPLVACMWVGYDRPRQIRASGDAGTLLAPWFLKTMLARPARPSSVAPFTVATGEGQQPSGGGASLASLTSVTH